MRHNALWIGLYSWTSVIWPPVIRISLLSGHDHGVYTVYFSLFHTRNLALNKNRVANFYSISFYIHFYMNNNLDRCWSKSWPDNRVISRYCTLIGCFQITACQINMWTEMLVLRGHETRGYCPCVHDSGRTLYVHYWRGPTPNRPISHRPLGSDHTFMSWHTRSTYVHKGIS